MIQELGSLVGPHNVRTSLPDRLSYQNDCWPRGIILTRGRRLSHHLPAAIVQPADEAEVISVIRWAAARSVPIVPFGAGSGVCGGAIGDQDSIVVDLKRLNQLLDVDPLNATARAQPGLLGVDMERRLQHAGFTMGHFPSSLYCSSLGGYLAARSAGQYSSRYGKIEDMVLSMRVVNGLGDVLTTAADYAAPWHSDLLDQRDLNQIFVGSEGTLGLITEALMRIEPLPDRLHYRGFQFPRLDLALEAIQEIMQAGLRPCVVRLYDEFDSLIGGSKKKGQIKAPGLTSRLLDRARALLPDSLEAPLDELIDASAAALLGRAVGRPLLLNTLAEVIPGHCLLVLGFEGSEPFIDDDAAYAFDICHRYGMDLGPGPGHHWLKNRFNVSYKQSPMFHMGAFVDTMEVSTTWDRLPHLYDEVRRALRPHVFVMAHFSHVYPEGSSIYFTFAGFAEDTDATLEKYEATWKAGLDAVAAAGASVAHHHGVGQSKAPWTHRDHIGGPSLFAALKRRVDPQGILNPGKVYP